MATIRVEKTKNYTVMSNRHLTDPRLSNAAIGLMCKMLSLPEEWDFSVVGLTKICKDGKSAIRSQLIELEECGYLRRVQCHNENGTFGGIDYILYENPDENEAAGDENQPFSDYPTSVKPSADKPTSDNRPQVNTKRSNKQDKAPISPAEKREKPGIREQAEAILLEAVGEDAELQRLVREFVIMRSQMKKPYKSLAGPTGAANRLRRYSDGDPEIMRAMLQNALDHEWQTFYPPNDNIREIKEAATPRAAPVMEVSAWR